MKHIKTIGGIFFFSGTRGIVKVRRGVYFQQMLEIHDETEKQWHWYNLAQ